MYLSKLVLNERQTSVHRDLGNAHKLHQRIMQGFPDEQGDNPRQAWNILYRQEPDSLVVLVQSAIAPDWSRLPLNYLLEKESDWKEVRWDASQFATGNLYQFRLKANPSKRDKETGKLLGMFRREDQLAWIERKASQHGFQSLGVDVIPVPNLFGVKAQGTEPIRIHSVIFQGFLQVTDPVQFIRSIEEGIGRGRSYGCGLLSIAKINPN
jgi:CRISPR system Cascade subunit CasE